MSRYDWPEPWRAATQGRRRRRQPLHRAASRRFDPRRRASRARGGARRPRARRPRVPRPARARTCGCRSARRRSSHGDTQRQAARHRPHQRARRASGRRAALCRVGATAASGIRATAARMWRSLGGLAATDTAGINAARASQRVPCHRRVMAAIDEVGRRGVGGYRRRRPQDRWTARHSVGGIGILHARGPRRAVRAPDPWKREANNLIGRGVYQIALEPGGTGVIAATPEGLFQRPPDGGENVPWVRIAAAPFDTLRRVQRRSVERCRCRRPPCGCGCGWPTAATPACGARDTGVSPVGPFKKVPLAANTPAAFAYPTGRGALAAGTPPAQVWAFANTGKARRRGCSASTNGAADPAATRRGRHPGVLTDQG